ncbi:4Fe-4S dicluster domain-containing protein [bacterium]|nr:4Fe-4S dicluster domain-containing protein [bacterium]
MSFGVLVDLTQCAGGRACAAACRQQHGQSLDSDSYVTTPGKRQDCYVGTEQADHRPPLSADRFTVVEYHDTADGVGESNWVFVKRQCMHCLEPACESACPVGAFHRMEEGPVVYDMNKCMGCRYCMMACPFNVPTYQWSEPIPYVKKCTFCVERMFSNEDLSREERIPACVAACPTSCLQFGERDELLAEAKRRIQQNPGRYVNHIYGEKEAGGTAWLYLSPVPFALLGFPTRTGERPYPEYTEAALDSVPPLIVFGGFVLAGIYLLWKRKVELAEQERAAGKDQGVQDG